MVALQKHLPRFTPDDAGDSLDLHVSSAMIRKVEVVPHDPNWCE